MKIILITFSLVFCFFFANGQQWIARQPVPTARKSAVAFAISNSIYVTGGTSASNSHLNSSHRYNPVTDLWIAAAILPNGGRRDAFGFVVSGKGYFGGGYRTVNGDPWYPSGEFYEYTPSTNQWVQKASLPENRVEAVGYTSEGSGHVALGSVGDVRINTNYFSQIIYRYVPSTNSWQNSNLFPPMTGNKCAVFQLDNGKTYFAGGYGLVSPGVLGVKNTVAWVNHGSQSFPSGTTTSLPVSLHSSAGMQLTSNTALVAGGNTFCGGTGLDDDCTHPVTYEYNSTTATWTQRSNIPFGNNAAAVAINPCKGVAYYGTGSSGVGNVNSFWYRVHDMRISGPAMVCTGGSSYQIYGLPSGATVQWYKTGTISSTNGSNNTTFNLVPTATPGTGSIWAVVSLPCGDISIPSITVPIGTPTLSVSTYSTYSGSNVYHTANAQAVPGAVNSDYKWYEEAPGGTPTTLIATGPQLYQWPIPLCTTKFYQLQVTTPCGVLVWRGYAFNPNGCAGSYMYVTSPNPASDDLSIEQSRQEIEEFDVNFITEEKALEIIETSKKNDRIEGFEIAIYNDNGKLIASEKIKEKRAKVDVRKYQKGTYIVKISDGINTVTQRVIVDK